MAHTPPLHPHTPQSSPPPHTTSGAPYIKPRRRKHKQTEKEDPEQSLGIVCCSACITLHCWIRDLCADGDIESQPGPRYVSKNMNSISGPGKLYQTFSSIREESTRDPLTAVFLQDHHIMAAKAEAVRMLAKKIGLLAITAFAPPGADGRGNGGVS